jgi:hypothetical protein
MQWRGAPKLFSVLPLLALPLFAQSTQPPVSDEDTLWDALAKTPTDSTPTPINVTPLLERVPLGPVPGFSLATPPRIQANTDDVFIKRKPKPRAVFGEFGAWIERLRKETGTKVDIKGQSLFSFRADSISGNSQSFLSDRYLGRGSNGFYNDTSVDVDATVFRHFRYKTVLNNNILNNPNDPNYNRSLLEYRTGKMLVEYGDINAGFQGNGLIDFNRFLNGVQYTQDWTRQFKTQLLYSRTRAETRTITINGNGSVGPYYVYAGQIVDGSVRVRVNEIDKVLGKDYTLDQYTGELRFLNGQVILPSDTIAVTFETIGFNQSSGNIYGMRTEFKPSTKVNLGMTYVAQTSNVRDTLQTRTQQFFGFGTPAAAYILDAPIDLTRPLTVQVGGLPLQRGIDFLVDPNLTNQIRIINAVPTSTIIQVTYTPLNVNPTPGNRNVVGFDSKINLGGYGMLRTDLALSGLDVQGSNFAGSAWQMRADLNLLRPRVLSEKEGNRFQPTLRAGLGYRSVSPTFSSIQTPGFNRNEKAVDFLADYQPSRQWRLNFNIQNAKRPSYASTNGQVSNFTIRSNGDDDYDQFSYGIVHDFRKGSVSLTRNSLGTRFLTGGNSTNDTDALNANYNTGRLSLDFALNSVQSNTQALQSTSGSSTPTTIGAKNSTTGSRFGLSWQTSSWLVLSSSFSNNDIRSQSATTDTHYTARDSEIRARFTLKNNIRLNYAYLLSDTGNSGTGSQTNNNGTGGTGGGTNLPPTRQSSGFTTNSTSSFLGGGSNFNLGGFGSYSGFLGNSGNSGYGASSFGGKSNGHRIGVEYQVRSINAALNYDHASSVGEYQFNSSRNNVSMNFGWQPTERMRLDMTIGLQNIAYNGGIGGSKGTTFSLGFSGRPFGKKLNISLDWLSVRTSSQIQFSGVSGTGGAQSPTDTSTNLSSLRGRLEYPVARRWTLFSEFLQSTTAGYLGGRELNLRLGADYSLNQLLRFSVGWQSNSRTNADPANSAFNYNVSTILAELGFNFR